MTTSKDVCTGALAAGAAVTAGPDCRPICTEEAERMVALLETSGRFRILRRLEIQAHYMPDGAPTRRGIFIDVETTGLDPALDEIIELAMLAFYYSSDGRICGAGEAYEAFRDPGRPIPAAVTALTGITDAMVSGRSIDIEKVSSFIGNANLIVAHNAEFDRRFCERLCGVFTKKAWACSYREVAWMEEGFDSARLGHLAIGHGLFFEAHRALDDCRAGLEILSRPLPRSGRSAFAAMLESARRARWRLWARGAPYASRSILKSRQYRWNDGSDGRPRAWYIDVAESAREVETQFLRQEVYGRTDAAIESQRVTAFDRYSKRC
jgi:DNA polymerase III subunit epsilon